MSSAGRSQPTLRPASNFATRVRDGFERQAGRYERGAELQRPWHGAWPTTAAACPFRQALRRSGGGNGPAGIGRSNSSVPAWPCCDWTTAPPCSAWIRPPTGSPGTSTWGCPGPTAGRLAAGVQLCPPLAGAARAPPGAVVPVFGPGRLAGPWRFPTAGSFCQMAPGRPGGLACPAAPCPCPWPAAWCGAGQPAPADRTRRPPALQPPGSSALTFLRQIRSLGPAPALWPRCQPGEWRRIEAHWPAVPLQRVAAKAPEAGSMLLLVGQKPRHDLLFLP